MKKTLLILFASLLTVTTQAIEKIKVGSTTREIIAYAPKNLPTSPALIIACHGYNQDAPYLQTYAKFEQIADTAKFVVVYANGEGKSWDISGTKDTQFMEVIIDSMHSRYHINKNRVYLTGFSMGGMFTYHCANKLSHKIAAFCPVSGYPMSGPAPAASRPVPILHTHGTGDETCSYSPVQSHIDAWVKFNGCNTTPVTISHYPNSSSPATRKRYLNGKNGVEVSLITLKDKGHWWSMDASQALTSVEVWNFSKKYSLGEDAPEVKSVSPENNSFDLVASVNNTFEVTFNEDVNCSKISASLVSASGKSVALDVASEGMQSVVSFRIPDGSTVEDGKQTLTINDAINKKEGVLDEYKVEYTFGVQELGERVEPTVIWDANLGDAKETTGEGIPYGWKRTMTSSSGAADVVKGNIANCGGCRLKYFEKGGDFDAGFYLSARDQSKCELLYGSINNYRLRLLAGDYTASFNSTYWSQSSCDNKSTFNFYVTNTNNETLFSATSLTSASSLNEKSDVKVSGSMKHEINFTISKSTYGFACFSMEEGWNSVVVGNIKITNKLTPAEKYKGGFINAIADARQALKDYESTGDEELKAVIAKYESFVSTSPTEYSKVTEEIHSAVSKFTTDKVPLVIETVNSTSSASSVYDLSGRRVDASSLRKGIYISNGKKFVK